MPKNAAHHNFALEVLVCREMLDSSGGILATAQDEYQRNP
jgi:hypothetical protein